MKCLLLFLCSYGPGRSRSVKHECGVQVVVAGGLVAVVRYGQARHWRLAEAAPHDDLSAGSFSSGSTAQGHQGYWVAQQVPPLHHPSLVIGVLTALM